MGTLREKIVGTGLGLLFVAVGTGIVLMVWRDPGQAEAPLWVVYAAASTFSFAGLWIILQTFALTLLANLAGLAIAYLLAVPGLWMLFDGKGANCSVSGAMADIALSAPATSWACRGIFGVGGLLVLIFALFLTRAAIRQARRAGQAAK